MRSSVLIALPLLGSFFGALGCDARSEAAATSPAVTPAPAAQALAPTPAAPPDDAAPSAQQSYREAEFTVALEGPASGKVGDTVTLNVKLEAASGYKVNQEYPLKFQLKKVDGIVAEKDTVLKGDAVFEGHGASLPVKIKLEKAGSHQLSGRLSFSVCKEGDASVCLLEKRELGKTLDAS